MIEEWRKVPSLGRWWSGIFLQVMAGSMNVALLKKIMVKTIGGRWIQNVVANPRRSSLSVRFGARVAGVHDLIYNIAVAHALLEWHTLLSANQLTCRQCVRLRSVCWRDAVELRSNLWLCEARQSAGTEDVLFRPDYSYDVLPLDLLLRTI